MSRRRTHVRAGVVAAALGLGCAGLAARWNPSIPVLAGALRTYHLLGGIVIALAGGWLGAQLPDLIEPARSPHHRGLWHSKLVGSVLVIGMALLASGFVLDSATPTAFFLRTASLFIMVGYASHLVLDYFSSRGLPEIAKFDGAGRLERKSSLLMRVGLTLILVLLAPSVVQAFWVFAEALLRHTAVLEPLAIGAALGVCADQMARSPLRGIYIFLHELTHAGAAMVTGRTVTNFVSILNGGFVAYQDEAGRTSGNIAISLAPYVFPLLTVLSVTARPTLPPNTLFWFDLWIGATISFHLLWTLRAVWEECVGPTRDIEEGVGQGDISKNGLIVSGLYILVVGLATWGVVFAVLLEGYSGTLLWAKVLTTYVFPQLMLGTFVR